MDIVQQVLDSNPNPLILSSPVLNDEGKIIDYKIEFVNSSYKNTDKHAKETPILLSDYVMNNPNFSVWLKKTEDIVLKSYEEKMLDREKEVQQLSKTIIESQLALKHQIDKYNETIKELKEAAYHDQITALPNRAWLKQKSVKYINQISDTDEKFAFIILDVDDMKNINESLGHNGGDKIIIKIAYLLKEFENDNITITKLGGDEFVIWYKNINNKQEVFDFAKNVLKSLNINEINMSGGISFYPEDSKSYDDLLKFADLAKSEVKKSGKNNIMCFEKVIQEKFMKKIILEQKLNYATANELFQLYFQPQFSASSNELRGFEALLRWHDDELGWISPEQFIPVAEECQLVIPIGDWVLDTSLKALKSWEEKYNFNGILSVNVSPIQFKKADFLEKFMEKINKYQITPSKLEIEITEGIMIDNVQEIITKLNAIKALGIGISLDDFGTGYSSLRYLQMLPLTTLKIDKSFVKNVSEANGIEANITQSIVSMVSKMGLDTIAEGVETQNQLDQLKLFNCKTIQGFLLGKPMPYDMCSRLISGDSSVTYSCENAGFTA